MSPPLISDYKKLFTLKRVFQTLLGGPILFAPPLFLILQVFIFLTPAALLSIVPLAGTIEDPLLVSAINGGSILLLEAVLNLVILQLKRSYRVHTSPSTPENHLSEEDNIYYRGILHSSTWVFIAPNVVFRPYHLAAITCSTLSFIFCTPIVIKRDTYILLRGLGLFSLCSARYSAVINVPPEIATFDTIRRKDLLYRPFYTFLIGFFFVIHSYFAEELNYENYALVLAILPLLWGFGLLPPLDAFFPWVIEWVLRVFGGSPSFFYFGSLIGILLVAFCTMFVFIIGQDYLLCIISCCCAGYFISCDAGLLLKLKESLCEDIPAKSFLVQVIKPLLTIATSLCVILLTVIPDISLGSLDYVLMGLSLTIAGSSFLCRKYLLSLRKLPKKAFLILYSFWDSLLMFFLHSWIALEVANESKPRTLDSQSLINLLMYVVTIRAFAVSIKEPKLSALDMSVTSLCLRYAPEEFLSPNRWTFTLLLLVVSLGRSRVLRFINYLKMMTIFTHATVVTPLLERKGRYFLAGILFLPISILSLTLTTLIEGSSLLPLFTLPLFLVGFPRPTSFFKERWFPKSKKEIQIASQVNEASRRLDWTIYSQISPLLVRGFLRKARKIRLKLEEGKCFLARCEDRLLFLRVIATSWNYIYIQVKGLEMQDQTSCHHQEAAWLDEMLERAFGSDQIEPYCPCTPPQLLSVTKPKMVIPISSYVEARSKLCSLYSPSDISILKHSFFRSFSFLLLKNSPTFKRRPIATGFQFNPVSPTFVQMFSDDGEDSDSTAECRDSRRSSKPKVFTYDEEAIAQTRKNGKNSSDDEEEEEEEDDEDGEDIVSESEEPESPPKNNNTNELFPYIPGMSDRARKAEARRLSTISHKLKSLDVTLSEEGNLNNLGCKGDIISMTWVQMCLGTSTKTRIFKGKVERFCKKAWKLVMGTSGEVYEIDLSKFYKNEFHKEVQRLTKYAKKGDIQELIVRAFRYASKIALDEIYNSGNGVLEEYMSEGEIFDQLTAFEREYKFCSSSEIADLIEENQKIIISIDQNEKGESQMRIFRFVPVGVEFRLAEMSRTCIEGIWANLNLELLYLTSDDDERFSIQHDRYLMRNITNQCADSPLGYAVYDAVFRINQFDISAERVA